VTFGLRDEEKRPARPALSVCRLHQWLDLVCSHAHRVCWRGLWGHPCLPWGAGGGWDAGSAVDAPAGSGL